MSRGSVGDHPVEVQRMSEMVPHLCLVLQEVPEQRLHPSLRRLRGSFPQAFRDPRTPEDLVNLEVPDGASRFVHETLIRG